jgi:hypothetical protein
MDGQIKLDQTRAESGYRKGFIVIRGCAKRLAVGVNPTESE